MTSKTAEQQFIAAMVGLGVVADTPGGRFAAFTLSVQSDHPKFAAIRAAQAAYRMDLRRELGQDIRPDVTDPVNWLPAIEAKIVVLDTTPDIAAIQSLTTDLEECVFAMRVLGILHHAERLGVEFVPDNQGVLFPRGTEAARLQCLITIKTAIKSLPRKEAATL